MPKSNKKPEPTRRDVLRWASAGAITTLFTTSFANYESGWLSVEHHELELPHWDANGFKVAVLADLHVDSVWDAEHTAQAMRLAIAEKPDLIAIPGDFITLGPKPDHALVLQSLEPLHDAKCPVVATLGNHDYDMGGITRVADTINQSAAKLLRTEIFELDGVSIAGIDDGIAEKYDTNFLGKKQFSKSLLALFHEPDYVDFVPTNVSLQLSGHSHGGQVCLPGGIPIHMPRGSKKYYCGFYPDARVPLYVTRGIGTTGPRWRLFCHPEVTILTLKGA